LNSGVHINSGIPNKAFYLAATKLGGYSWDVAGKIWYDTLLDPALKAFAAKKSNWGNCFNFFAGLTVKHAAKYQQAGIDVPATITESWQEVGVVANSDKSKGELKA
jgi:Zn-dependent metalloprotease